MPRPILKRAIDPDRINRAHNVRINEQPQRTTSLDANGDEQHGDSYHWECNNEEERPPKGRVPALSRLNSLVREEHRERRRKSRAESPPKVRSVPKRRRKGKEPELDREENEISGAIAAELQKLKQMFQESQVASRKSTSLLAKTEPPFTNRILSYHMSSCF